MANGRTDLGNAKTVILPDAGDAGNRATKILPRGTELPLETRPSNLPKTEVVNDPSGNNEPIPDFHQSPRVPQYNVPHNVPQGRATVPMDADTKKYPPDPSAISARPGHYATQVLTPEHERRAAAELQKASESAGDLHLGPVVGWLVVVKGFGRGHAREIFMGNNSIGRSHGQRIRLDFGDTAISEQEQAFIRYDYQNRSFHFIPNMSKMNIVTVNDDKPMMPVLLKPFDEIGVGTTKLRFVPFCTEEFDWSEVDEK